MLSQLPQNLHDGLELHDHDEPDPNFTSLSQLLNCSNVFCMKKMHIIFAGMKNTLVVFFYCRFFFGNFKKYNKNTFTWSRTISYCLIILNSISEVSLS